YHDKFVVTQLIQTIPDIHEVTGYVEYMTCDDTRCLPPTPVDFIFQFESSSNSESEDGNGLLAEPKKKDNGTDFGSIDLSESIPLPPRIIPARVISKIQSSGKPGWIITIRYHIRPVLFLGAPSKTAAMPIRESCV